MAMSEVATAPQLLLFFAFVWGCLWASFINVVIYRVPRGMSVVTPPSHCPGCGAPVAAFDNIPVFSWLLLRGRARCCGLTISPRYVAVEVLGGALSMGVAERVLLTSPASASIEHAGAIFLADFALTMALLAAAFIDAEHMYLPDSITIGGTLFGLATPALHGLTWAESALGAAIGFVGVWLPFVVGYQALRGRAGMGLGDAKLLMLAGAWFGWLGAAFALFGGAVQASLAAVMIVILRGKIEEPEAVRADRAELLRAAAAGDEDARVALEEDPLGREPDEGWLSARIPFGPFLCLAIVEWMLLAPFVRDSLPF